MYSSRSIKPLDSFDPGVSFVSALFFFLKFYLRGLSKSAAAATAKGGETVNVGTHNTTGRARSKEGS